MDEFLQQWRCEPLLIPTYYFNREEPARARWTKSDAELIKTRKSKEGDVATKPREHFRAVEPDKDTYFLFPMDTWTFCRSWALQ